MATVDASFYQLLLKELLLIIPISFYLVTLFTVLVIFLYILLEVHIVDDIFSGFRGNYVSLTVDSTSKLYKEVVSKCSLLHGRYFCTPWLCSPHLQTILLHLLVETYNFNYKRELFRSSDGGTIALDRLINFDVDGNNMVARVVPVVIVIPGLTSDSDSPVKYLGEDGTNAPIVGAASICNPWDLLFLDNWLHRVVYARIADWEGIEKARSVGDGVNKATARITERNLSTNRNIVLATTLHGGHNAFFEGMSGKNLWWVRVVEEYFSVLCSSTLMNKTRLDSFDQFLPKKVRDRFAWVKRQSVIDKATYCHDTTSLAPFVSANEDLMKLKQEVASLLEVPEEGNINEVADDAREKLADL
ncbi:hypothetical protein Tco_0489628 [Tanacetum coccineum]